MKLFTDENIGFEVVVFLRSAGFDVVSATEKFPSAPDFIVLQRATDDRRILITSDTDFGELVYNQKLAHYGVILLRLIDERNANKIKVLSKLLKTYQGKLKNNFVVVTENKIRIRSPKNPILR